MKEIPEKYPAGTAHIPRQSGNYLQSSCPRAGIGGAIVAGSGDSRGTPNNYDVTTAI